LEHAADATVAMVVDGMRGSALRLRADAKVAEELTASLARDQRSTHEDVIFSHSQLHVADLPRIAENRSIAIAASGRIAVIPLLHAAHQATLMP
jgi:hypothetical protein